MPIDVDNVFGYHKPNQSQLKAYELIRARFIRLAKDLQDLIPDSAELTIAIRKLHDSLMATNAAIAINECDFSDSEVAQFENQSYIQVNRVVDATPDDAARIFSDYVSELGSMIYSRRNLDQAEIEVGPIRVSARRVYDHMNDNMNMVYSFRSLMSYDGKQTWVKSNGDIVTGGR